MIHFDEMNDKNKCDVLAEVFWQQQVLKTEDEKDWIPELWLEMDLNNLQVINSWMYKQNVVYSRNEIIYLPKKRNKILVVLWHRWTLEIGKSTKTESCIARGWWRGEWGVTINECDWIKRHQDMWLNIICGLYPDETSI